MAMVGSQVYRILLSTVLVLSAWQDHVNARPITDNDAIDLEDLENLINASPSNPQTAQGALVQGDVTGTCCAKVQEKVTGRMIMVMSQVLAIIGENILTSDLFSACNDPAGCSNQVEHNGDEQSAEADSESGESCSGSEGKCNNSSEKVNKSSSKERSNGAGSNDTSGGKSGETSDGAGGGTSKTSSSPGSGTSGP